MPSTALTIPNEVLSAIGLQHRKTLVQTQHNQYPASAMLMRHKKPAVGDILIMPFDVRKHSQPQKINTGWEAYSKFAQTIMDPGYSQPNFLVQPVLISAIDRAKNAGQAHLIDIAKSRITNVEMHLHQQLTRVFFQGPSASGTYTGEPEWSGWNTLNGVDGSLGLLEANTSGTNTFNNLSKGNYPAATNPLMHNLWASLSDAAGQFALNALHQMMIDLEIRYGKGLISSSRFEWYMSRLLKGFIKRALRAFEQYASDGAMDDGKRTFETYMGVPVIPTVELPQLGATTTGAPVSAMLLDWDAIEFQLYSDWGFTNTNWVDISGLVPGTQASLFMIGGNIVFGPAGSFGMLSDGEVY